MPLTDAENKLIDHMLAGPPATDLIEDDPGAELMRRLTWVLWSGRSYQLKKAAGHENADEWLNITSDWLKLAKYQLDTIIYDLGSYN